MSKIYTNGLRSLNIQEIKENFENRPKEIKVLSLDCFDTLLWRTVASPTDVFADLQCHPLFLRYGISENSRRLAEREARNTHLCVHGQTEINIHEIYEQLLPQVRKEVIDEFVNLEIEAEKKYLFPYIPMFDLLQKARASGLKTIVVSDMYIHEHQLEDLIKTAAMKLGIDPHIDHYFVSSKYRTTKRLNLFHKVSEKIGLPPQAILHYGDNKGADCDGAIENGVHGFHFNRFTPLLEDTLQQSVFMQKLLLKDHGETEPIRSSIHAALSLLPPTSNTLEKLGWYQLGPLLCQYSYWLNEKIEELKKNGKKIKLAFMMRDGHLPMKVHQSLLSQSLVSKEVTPLSISVSRFATVALNFSSIQKIKKFIQSNQFKLSREELIYQLLGGNKKAIEKIEIDAKNELTWEEFTLQITQRKNINIIVSESIIHKENFVKYIAKEVRLQKGETLVLADLGYAGTIQDQITGIIEEEFGAEVQGMYLILKESANAPQAKFGFIDYRQLTTNSVNLLLSQIQTLEQFAVNDNGSLLEYATGGIALCGKNHLDTQQIKYKKDIQSITLDFARTHARQLFKLWRVFGYSSSESAGLLARFTIKPTASEIQLYKNFVHDVNNGTNKGRWISNLALTKSLIDRNTAASFDSDTHKMVSIDLNVLQPADAYLNLMQKRLGHKIQSVEFIDETIELLAIVIDDKDYKEITVPCIKTHDGYKLALVSNIQKIKSVGIRFGSLYSWVQIQEICTAVQHRVLTDPHWLPVVDLKSSSKVEGGKLHGKDLVNFADASGFFYIDLQKNKIQDVNANCLVIVFRDIAPQLPEISRSYGGEIKASKEILANV